MIDMMSVFHTFFNAEMISRNADTFSLQSRGSKREHDGSSSTAMCVYYDEIIYIFPPVPSCSNDPHKIEFGQNKKSFLRN